MSQTAARRSAPWRSATRAQLGMELRLTSRRGENLLAIAVIPAVVLAFFASTSLVVVPGGSPVDFLLPGALALAVIAAGLVNLGIATAYERSYGVLKRLGGSPLGRDGLVTAKIGAVGVIVFLQVVLLFVVAAILGWRPGPGVSPLLLAVALGLGTVTFASLGLLLAGTLRAEATLALANGLFIAAFLLGGILVPTSHLPAPLAVVADLLPAAALTEALRVALGGAGDQARAMVTLARVGNDRRRRLDPLVPLGLNAGRTGATDHPTMQRTGEPWANAGIRPLPRSTRSPRARIDRQGWCRCPDQPFRGPFDHRVIEGRAPESTRRRLMFEIPID